MLIRRVLAVAVACAIAATGCTAASDPSPTPPLHALTSPPGEPAVVLAAETPAELAIATSQALFDHAPVVALASEDDLAGQQAASELADAGAPLLLVPAGAAPAEGPLADELDRLDPAAVVPYGDAAASWLRTSIETGGDADQPAVLAPGEQLPVTEPPPPLASLLVLTPAADDQALAATATAQASGARLLPVTGPDPRGDPAAIQALAAAPAEQVLALGAQFGPVERLQQRLAVAATGVELPGGGQLVFPGRRMVALYGHPGNPELGALGEQELSEAVDRTQATAAEYQAHVDEPVVPVFEIITTVASSSPGPNGDYSLTTPVEQLRPWVDAAAAAGIYVVLDLQPGRTDFLTQAKLYEELLVQPHVGLALDPEWRLTPDQVHLEQIGSVTAAEVNQVAGWLAELTREHHLPQKLLVLHQFRLSMITDRDQLDTSHDELAMLVHADGHGTPADKLATWQALLADAPDDLWWGWKNFYDEDQPTFTEAETVEVEPSPLFISYQ